MYRSNLRKQDRFPANGHVVLNWQAAGCDCAYTRGRSLNVSASGLAAKVEVEVKANTVVRLSCEDPKLTGSAVVRYCKRVGMKYLVGLEFVGALRYTPPVAAQAVAAVEEVRAELTT